jgi:hypothetical protein
VDEENQYGIRRQPTAVYDHTVNETDYIHDRGTFKDLLDDRSFLSLKEKSKMAKFEKIGAVVGIVFVVL